MKRLFIVSLFCFVCGIAHAQFKLFDLFRNETPFDFNGDKVIRCAILGTAEKEQQVDSRLTCQDLEQMIKNAKPGMPVRVVFEEITAAKSVMGWWYHPDAKERRDAFTATAYDYVFVIENEAIAAKFPELFFEGVRITRSHFNERKTCVMLLMMDSPPVSSVWDDSVKKLNEITYRVGDGCGVGVIPAALAWQDVLLHHILPGKSLLKIRANSYLAASAIWHQVSGESVPRASLTTDWIVKKKAEMMAKSAEDAVKSALRRRHYSRPFEGVVRTGSRQRLTYLFYHAGSTANPALKDALGFVTDSAGRASEQYSVDDWYAGGLDRNSLPLDLVCGSMQEMEPLLEGSGFTSAQFRSPKLPEPVKVVYNRNPSNDASGELTLRNLEELLMEGYRFARKNELVFIPYQVAWARLWSINPDYVRPAPGSSSNDWLTYMLAGMIYTALTGDFEPPPERNMPTHYNDTHPRGFHPIAARTGWQCMRQLSSLKPGRNTIVTSSSGWHLDSSSPAFIRMRLLEAPVEPVRVLCAPVDRGMLGLSQEAFEFDSSNYDIEQTLRCSVVGLEKNVFSDVLISAVSEDADIDGVNRKHIFLCNHREEGRAGFVAATNEVSIGDQSRVMLKPGARPVDLVFASVIQNGVETETLCFSPDYFDNHSVSLFPDSEAIESGKCEITLRVRSRDSRFDGLEEQYVFKLNYGSAKVPEVRVVASANGASIEGPAFVTAEARVAGAEGPFELSLYCGRKRLGTAKTAALKAGVEMGPPLSRLAPGKYPLWAAVRLKSGLVASSPVSVLEVTQAKPEE